MNNDRLCSTTFLLLAGILIGGCSARLPHHGRAMLNEDEVMIGEAIIDDYLALRSSERQSPGIETFYLDDPSGRLQAVFNARGSQCPVAVKPLEEARYRRQTREVFDKRTGERGGTFVIYFGTVGRRSAAVTLDVHFSIEGLESYRYHLIKKNGRWIVTTRILDMMA